MKTLSVAILLTVLFGCAAPPIHTGDSDEMPELISTTPLPQLLPGWCAGGIKINVLLHILQDGTVDTVKIIGSSGDSDWDTEAARSIRQWRFSRPRRSGQPSDLWCRKLIVVQVQEPRIMAIGAVEVPTSHQADSLWSLLELGETLDQLFTSRLDTLDIGQYPQRIREVIKGLRIGEYTKPVRRGDAFVIFKRYPCPGRDRARP